MPLLAPTNSPMMAPTTASEEEIRRAEKINGDALKKRSFSRICVLDALYIRNKYSSFSCRALKPLMEFTNAGKKQINAAAMTFGAIPVPTQSNKSGAIATIGVVFRAIAIGITALSRFLTYTIRTANEKANMLAMMNPRTASMHVSAVSKSRVEKLLMISCVISQGVGSKY